MLDIGTLLRHYKRKDIQDEIIRCSPNKELVGSYKGEGYAKRPDVLQYGNDILEQVKNGVTSFHMSEETWSNPLQISPMMKRQDIEKLRTGWDLVLDIDCKFLEYSKIAGHYLIEALKYFKIKSVTCKFSGNHGFHIAVPFEAFPTTVNGMETRTLFPEAPRVIANFLKEMIRKHLAKKILEVHDINTVMRMTGKKLGELTKDGKFDPFAILEIDTILISSRHLFRAPYAFNEKSGLVSVPIDINKVMEFDREQAKPENVKVEHKFLERDVEHGEAKNLIVQAYDFKPTTDMEVEEKKKKYEEDIPQDAIPEKFFPPCVNKISAGLEDGKKRAVFIIINFLRSCGWDYDKIEEYLREWNKRNKEDLREVVMLGQLRYHKTHKKQVLPPNCDNKMYYHDFHVCNPDKLCERIKNPVNYAKAKTRMQQRAEQKESRKLTDEQKAERKKMMEERKKFKEEVKKKLESGELKK